LNHSGNVKAGICIMTVNWLDFNDRAKFKYKLSANIIAVAVVISVNVEIKFNGLKHYLKVFI